MKVIAGKLGGRQFQSPHGHRTHPMSEKMRGALFNMLGDISGLSVLDAFAGTGALSFEAISRGAREVVAVETSKMAHAAIAENIQLLQLTEIDLYKANVGTWSNNRRTFDVVLADPPYDHLHMLILNKLVRNLAPGGTYALSWPGKEEAPKMPGLEMVTGKNYGDSQLVFYRHIR